MCFREVKIQISGIQRYETRNKMQDFREELENNVAIRGTLIMLNLVKKPITRCS